MKLLLNSFSIFLERVVSSFVILGNDRAKISGSPYFSFVGSVRGFLKFWFQAGEF